jgi:nitrate reductase (cytochrome), electron transfer subunit
MPESRDQLLHIGAVAAASVALIAFLMGTSDDAAPEPPLAPAALSAPSGDAPQAPTYTALRDAPFATGEGWTADTRSLRGPGVLDEVDLAGTSRAEAVGDRSENRAFDGAPPTIPHPVGQDGPDSCLACHDDGLRLRGAVASPMSHDTLTNCTQCHVPALAPAPGAALPPDATFAANVFVGMASPERGPRAAVVSPPQVPHRTAMRERCTSCHGPNGRDAMKSTHPDRQSCSQCHASPAALDLRPATGGTQ